jgi:hypothetical protein
MSRFFFKILVIAFCAIAFCGWTKPLCADQTPTNASSVLSNSTDDQKYQPAAHDDLKIVITNLSKLSAMETIDLGELPYESEKVVSKKIKLVNQTGKTITITRILPSCPCLSAHLATDKKNKKDEIPVKGDRVIEVEVSTSELPHGEFLRTIEIGFGKKSAITVAITGRPKL